MPGTVLTSGDIAASIAAFRDVSPFAANPFYEQAAGGMLNRIGAATGPLVQGGLGLMGMDPMSLGMRAFGGAFTGGAGLGMSTAAGLGAAAAVGVPLMVGGYMGNQMFSGMQQQQALNNTLRRNFSFFTPNGQGFNRSQMGDIGSMMREMTHQFGPGGEISSYRELTALAGQMGQMGMARGVRDVQDFSRRFKEMVEAAKTMARDLGTTLEGAVQTMQSLRNSGVFKVADQMKFTGVARNMALTGGLALTEVNAMASIGAQVSRSIGGTGRQGAFAGARAIGTVGTANQLGALSDEDIYNATGLTGAEGRQALATNMLQLDAQFLKTGRGRRILAALADKNGQLDEGAVSEFMSGGFSIGRTVELDNRMKSRVGRANFIRNEGRLRGAVLERFGGNVNVMSLMGWASGKGIDINDMDDRSMLFAQRQLGMGRDEFEVALKMAQGLPDILRDQNFKKFDDSHLQKLADYKKTHGFEGLRTRFAQAKESVNGKLQEVGAKIFQEGSEYIEQMMNKMADVYVQRMHAEADSAYRSAVFGNNRRFEQVFGVGAGGKTLGRPSGDMFGGAGPGSAFDRFSGKNRGVLDSLFSGTTDRQKYEKFGYSFSDIDAMGGDKDAAFSRRMREIQQMQFAATGGVNKGDVQLGMGAKSMLGDYFAFGSTGKNGFALVNDFETKMASKAAAGDTNAAQILNAMRAAKTPAEKAKVLHGLSVGSGGDFGEVGARMGYGQLDTFGIFAGGGAFRSEGERRDAYFSAFFGRDKASALERTAAAASPFAGAAAGAITGLAYGPLGALVGGVAGYMAADKATEGMSFSMAKDEAAAAYLASDRFTDQAAGLYSTDAAERIRATEQLQKEARNLIAKDPTGKDAALQGQLEGMKGARAGQLALEWEATHPNQQMTEAQAEAMLNELGIKRNGMESATAQIKRYGNVGKGILWRQQKETRDLYANKLREEGQGLVANLQGGGFAEYTDGELRLSAMAAKDLSNLNVDQQMVVKNMLKLTQSKQEATGDTVYDTMQLEQAVQQGIGGMSLADKRKLASALRTSGGGAFAGRIEAEAAYQDKVTKMISKKGGGSKGVAATMAQELGLGVSDKDMQEINKLLSQGKEGQAANLLYSYAQEQGFGNVENLKARMQKALAHGSPLQGGGKVDASQDILGIKQSDEFKKAQQEKKEKELAAQDPLQAKIRDNTNEMVKYLKLVLQSTDRGFELLAKSEEEKKQ